jgi:phosphoribosyl 1,2-cyclic phosphodiesterase
VRLLICGVRGSTPAPGAEFARYGGETSCIAIAGDSEPPRLVLDAGTGLRRLTRLLDGQPFRGTLLLGHLHWDHTHGIPFFPAGDRPDAAVNLLMPAQGDGDAAAVLSRCMSPPHFPITPWELRGDWSFDGIEEGEHSIEGFSVLALEIPHKGGRTFGYRVSDGHSSIAYMSDHGPISLGVGPEGLGEYHPAALQLARGVDLLIHDAQHTAAEFPQRAHFGHSAIEYAVGLAERAGVSRLLLFHHDPARTDDELDALLAVHRLRFPALDAATEGTVIDVPVGATSAQQRRPA